MQCGGDGWLDCCVEGVGEGGERWSVTLTRGGSDEGEEESDGQTLLFDSASIEGVGEEVGGVMEEGGGWML